MYGNISHLKCYFSYRVFCFAVCFLCIRIANVSAEVPIIEGTPEGFEVLEQPRKLVVTLYYGGDVLGNFAAQYMPGSLAFEHPEDILPLLPNISDESQVGAILASPLPTHAELLCHKQQQKDCGVLQPTIAGIIFDEDQLSAEVFIHPDYVALQDGRMRYLPLPKQDFSSVYRFNGSVAGVDSNAPNFAIGSDSTYAYGEYYFNNQSTLSNEGLRFDTASMGVERNGWGANAGLIRSRSLQLGGEVDIAGASYYSSIRTQLDSSKVEGNDILIYLPRRAYVSIYREGRLYSSRSYEAGNQRIDTSELPDGAYNITLKIQEVDGTAREETRFFAKSDQIPPADAPIYFLQAGVVRNAFNEEATIPELTDKPVIRAGNIFRASENLALGASVLGIKDRAASEFIAYYLSGGNRVQATALASSKKDFGLQLGWQYIGSLWYASLDMRKLIVPDMPAPEYNGLLSEISQANASVNYLPYDGVVLGIRANYSENNISGTSKSYGPTLSWRLWQQNENNIYLTADAAQTNRGFESNAMVRFTYRLGNYGVSSEGGASSSANGRGVFAGGRIWYDRITDKDNILIGAGVVGDRKDQNVNADGEWHSEYGHLQASMQKAFGTNASLGYASNFSFGAAQADGDVHVGGYDPNSSAIAIETSGDSKTELAIFLNSVQYSTIHSGESKIIYVTPYQRYRVRLQTLTEGMHRIEGGEQIATVYPGNVAHLKWRVNEFVVLIAQVYDESGQPLANARLDESTDGIITNEQGWFQAELSVLDNLHFTTPDRTCSLTIPKNYKKNKNNIMLISKPLICKE